MENRLTLTAVAFLVGVSTKTIENWYTFKKKNPDNEYAQLLPDYEQDGNRQTRYWNYGAISQLENFRDTIPKGMNGVMGSVTNKKGRKKNESRRAKKSVRQTQPR